MLLIAIPAVVFLAPVVQGDSVEIRSPDKSIEIPTGDFGGVQELSNGQLLIVRPSPAAILLVDLSGKKITTLGRRGSGLGEYRVPVGIIPLPDGKFYVSDPTNLRFLKLSAAGTIMDTVPFRKFKPVAELLMAEIPLTDDKGRWYFEIPTRAAFLGDSSRIIRWTIGKATVDTVGFIKEFLSRDPYEMMKERTPRPEGPLGIGGQRSGGRPLYEPQESWTVGPSGRLIRVSPSPFQVIWYVGPLKPAAGPEIPYEPVPVDEQERKRYLENMREASQVRRHSRAGDTSDAEFTDEIDFTIEKPPFPNRSAALIAPRGELWVRRSTRSSDAPYYDRFDQSGKPVGKVILPADATIVGVSKTALYMVRPAAAGKLTLGRYRWPQR